MTPPSHLPTRRDALRAGLVTGLGLAVGRLPLLAVEPGHGIRHRQDVLTRPIPSTGERIPVVGLGTNRFSVDAVEDVAVRCEVIESLADAGGSVIDTARGYGRAEEVIGGCIEAAGSRDRYFLVTKYSQRGEGDAAAARAGLEEAFTRLRTDVVDVMLVHNLGGTETLLPVMREMKEAGRFRYLGVSTSSDRQYEALEQLMRAEELDVLQVDYSIGNRTAAERILPLAADRGTAVMLNVPFGGGRRGAFTVVGDRPLPGWAGEIGAVSWAQVFLKYVLSHPSVTVAVPGTTNRAHVADNLGAARGAMPDAALRTRMEQFFDAL